MKTKTLFLILIAFGIGMLIYVFSLDNFGKKKSSLETKEINNISKEDDANNEKKSNGKENDKDFELITSEPTSKEGGIIAFGHPISIEEAEPNSIRFIKLNNDRFITIYKTVTKSTSEFEKDKIEYFVKVGIIEGDSIGFGPKTLFPNENIGANSLISVIGEKGIIILHTKGTGEFNESVLLATIGKVDGDAVSFGPVINVLGQQSGTARSAKFVYDENHFIFVYSRWSGPISEGQFAVIGTIDENNEISLGKEYRYGEKGTPPKSQNIIQIAANTFLISWEQESIVATISDNSILFGKKIEITNPISLSSIKNYGFAQIGEKEIRFGVANNGEIIYSPPSIYMSEEVTNLGRFIFNDLVSLNENDFMVLYSGVKERGYISPQPIIRVGTIKDNIIYFYPDIIPNELGLSSIFSLGNNRFLAFLNKDNKLIVGSLNSYLNKVK